MKINALLSSIFLSTGLLAMIAIGGRLVEKIVLALTGFVLQLSHHNSIGGW